MARWYKTCVFKNRTLLLALLIEFLIFQELNLIVKIFLILIVEEKHCRITRIEN